MLFQFFVQNNSVRCIVDVLVLCVCLLFVSTYIRVVLCVYLFCLFCFVLYVSLRYCIWCVCVCCCCFCV